MTHSRFLRFASGFRSEFHPSGPDRDRKQRRMVFGSGHRLHSDGGDSIYHLRPPQAVMEGSFCRHCPIPLGRRSAQLTPILNKMFPTCIFFRRWGTRLTSTIKTIKVPCRVSDKTWHGTQAQTGEASYDLYFSWFGTIDVIIRDNFSDTCHVFR